MHPMFALMSRLALLFALAVGVAASRADADRPGEGISVQPIMSVDGEQSFQTELVMQALEDLGFDVRTAQELEPAAAHLVLGRGEASFLAYHHDPRHAGLYRDAGGDAKLYRRGVLSPDALQGYLIDKATAERYRISKISQLADPRLASLFDSDGDGRADLTGCNPGWHCAEVIEHQLDAYGLRATVTQHQGSYSSQIAQTIARARSGEPVLYYGWTPHWVSGALVPGRDVVWLKVPAAALPGESASAARRSDGQDYGFPINKQRIVASKAFTDANPAAARLFETMRIPARDISAQNLRMRQGENRAEDIVGHVQAWIRGHQQTYQSWLKSARAAARGRPHGR